MEICLLHAQWSDFWSAISVTRVTETGVHGWRQCESLLSPSEALQLVSISVVCSLFAHHMFPSENWEHTTSPKSVISWCKTCWTWVGTSQDTQETNLNGAMSLFWGRATSGYWGRSCHNGYLPCGRLRSIQWGGYPSQVESGGTTGWTPKSLKWSLHKERSDACRIIRASSMEAMT